jgi:hypothetical protein
MRNGKLWAAGEEEEEEELVDSDAELDEPVVNDVERAMLLVLLVRPPVVT